MANACFIMAQTRYRLHQTALNPVKNSLACKHKAKCTTINLHQSHKVPSRFLKNVSHFFIVKQPGVRSV